MQKLYKKSEANYPRLDTDELFIDYNNTYKLKSFIKDDFDFVNKAQLKRTDLWKRFVQQFREDADYEAGWRGEYWGKMMRGACWVYGVTKDNALYKILAKTIQDMMNSADKFGRISSYGIDHEFDGWDLWSRKYVLLGMQYFIEICPDNAFKKDIIKSMCNQVNYIMSKIGPEDGKRNIAKCTRHWRGLNSCSILEPIVRLYTLTKDKKYFNFATYIVELGGTDVANVFDLAYEDEFYPYQYPVTKAYEMTSCFEGLLEYYRITKNERYKTALVNYANKILESDFTIIGSCGCTHELFDHSTVRQANTNNEKIMQETCVTVTMMKFFLQLYLLTGNLKYADAIETSFYNAYLGSFNTDSMIEPMLYESEEEIEIEALPFDSYAPLTAGTRGNGIGGLKVMSDKHYYGCCACIASLGLGLACKTALLTSKNGFAFNLYLPMSVTSKTPSGQDITFDVKTELPTGGKTKMKIDIEKPEEFEIRFRLPSWSNNSQIKVGDAFVSVNGPIFELKQTWGKGDVIELNFDMTTHVIRPIPYGHDILMNKVIWGSNYMVATYDTEDPIAKHHVAFQRGPIVLAQENRLGYSVDEAVEFKINDDETIDVELDKDLTVPYKCLIKAKVPLADGSNMTLTDYSSAGKDWTQRMAAWILTK